MISVQELLESAMGEIVKCKKCGATYRAKTYGHPKTGNVVDECIECCDVYGRDPAPLPTPENYEENI